jgi:hypothetical protein
MGKRGDKMYYTEPYYYCISPAYIKTLLAKSDGGEELFSSLSFASKEDCALAKERIEAFLSSQNLLCRSWWLAVDRFIQKEPLDFVSIRLTDVKCDWDRYTGWGVTYTSSYKYGFKWIDLVFYRILLANDEKKKRKRHEHKGTAIEYTGASTFELLAKMIWDAPNDRIILTPLIISEMH